MPTRHVTDCTSLRLQKYRNITNKSNNLPDFYQNRLQNIICFLLFEPYCHINQFIKKKSQSTYCGKNGFKRKYVEEFLSKKEKELLLKIKHKKKDNRPYGELARTYTHVRKILRVHLFYELQRNLESRQKVFVFKKSNKRKAFAYRAFRLLMGWVAGGTRTHDIQNHNLTL